MAMVDWLYFQAAVRALQAERGAWRCSRCQGIGANAAHTEYGYGYCEMCKGTGKYRNTQEIVCKIHADLGAAWTLGELGKIRGTAKTAPHVAWEIGNAALRALDLASYLNDDLSHGYAEPLQDHSMPALFADVHARITKLLDGSQTACLRFLCGLELIADRIHVDLGAIVRESLDDMKERERQL